ncbi:unnamed protein product [Acidithrix sp. C25]|nr:unnamed protein product [Acidithrix sp. C25]
MGFLLSQLTKTTSNKDLLIFRLSQLLGAKSQFTAPRSITAKINSPFSQRIDPNHKPQLHAKTIPK